MAELDSVRQRRRNVVLSKAKAAQSGVESRNGVALRRPVMPRRHTGSSAMAMIGSLGREPGFLKQTNRGAEHADR